MIDIETLNQIYNNQRATRDLLRDIVIKLAKLDERIYKVEHKK